MLARWDEEGTFAQLREQNRGGPIFSFMDGPITANGPAGVHHGIGRTLKDVFQRYKASRGHELRYQNGFDSQGLHVEVQVEKALGFNSKREIEEYGLARFARDCRDFVAKFSGVQTAQSKRLGMWMDWGNDYFTFSDTNIEYIWRFLKAVEEKGWLYKGHRSTQWCPRCGTSLSKHEQAGEENYEELEHPSLFVRFPLRGRAGESLVIWTTTPWTLPANVAAAVKPDAEYGRNDVGEWVAVEPYPDEHFEKRVRGSELVGLEYDGPFDAFPAQEGVVHRVIPWDEVSLDEGTGIVHIAPGCGAEDFELARLHDLPVLAPIDESGVLLPGYSDLEGKTTDEVVDPVIESLRERGLLVEATSVVHRYPVCWRCRTPLVFRVVDDWFISAEEIRQPMLDGNATVEWTPPQYKKRMDDWLRNMGDWCGASTSSRSCTARGSTASSSAARSAAARRSGFPRSATRGSTPASSTSRRSAGGTRSGSPAATRPAPRRGSPAPTFPTTPIGRSGSRPTGSRRGGRRFASGSTRSASWR